MRPLRSFAFLSIGMLVLIAGCASDRSTRSAQPMALTPPELSDGEIAAVMNAINLGQTELAQMAKMAGLAEPVRDYADRIMMDHSQAMQRQVSNVEKRGVRPVDNALARQLAAEFRQATDSLRGLVGAEFDRAFLDAEFRLHARVLEVLDNKLLPSVRDPLLDVELRTTRANVSEHYQLAQARRLVL